MAKETKRKRSLGTFTILLLILLLVSMATWLTNGKTYTDANGKLAVVHGATLSNILMAPINGWHNAGDVIGFVFCLGVFLSILNATGALKTGIHSLVKKLHGKEMILRQHQRA